MLKSKEIMANFGGCEKFKKIKDFISYRKKMTTSNYVLSFVFEDPPPFSKKHQVMQHDARIDVIKVRSLICNADYQGFPKDFLFENS